MAEQGFVRSLEDLTGKVAIVTGGAATIGLATTVYLAAQGCTVYVASRNREKSEHGIAEAEKKLNGRGGSIKFHHLDLSTIEGSRRSAEEFKKLEGRLDIIVGNAAIGVEPMDELSEDGWDRAFATNHLGHFAFVTSLLDLVEKTASQQGEARIVMVSSEVYKTATKLDYDALRTRIEGDGNSVWQLKAAFIRYCNTKLANVYFTAELDRRLQSRGIKNVYCNSCHPGLVSATGIGKGQKALGPYVEGLVRKLISLFSNTVEDAAKTQVYLAASKDVREKDIHGEYWQAIWTWTRAYSGVTSEEQTALGKDEEEQKKLWDVSEAAMKEAAPSALK